jgi:carbon monoxide dehydrogenase subunit G
MTERGRYEFTTEWMIPAPPDRVWTELMDPERWPQWWPGVVRVETMRDGEPNGVGAVRRYTFRSRLPYRLTFTMETTRIERHQLIEGRASGELKGHGCWRLYPAGGGTRVLYDWHVEITKPWMKRLDPIARRLFEWNHDVVMGWGRRGLLRRIAASP